MNVRLLTEDDIPAIRRIHSQYYEHEFDLSTLFNNPLGLFVVTNGDDEIICVGNVRTIIESVLITDKSFSVRQRREALYKVLEVSAYIGKNKGYDELHAFIQDKTWEKHLEKVGFYPTKGKSLVLQF